MGRLWQAGSRSATPRIAPGTIQPPRNSSRASAAAGRPGKAWILSSSPAAISLASTFRRRCGRRPRSSRRWHRFLLPDAQSRRPAPAGKWHNSMALRKSAHDSSLRVSPRQNFVSAKLWKRTGHHAPASLGRTWARSRSSPTPAFVFCKPTIITNAFNSISAPFTP